MKFTFLEPIFMVLYANIHGLYTDIHGCDVTVETHKRLVHWTAYKQGFISTPVPSWCRTLFVSIVKFLEGSSAEPNRS